MNYIVAVNTPFRNSLLTYKSEVNELKRGVLVKVPLGKRTVDGVVVGIDKDSTTEYELKEIHSVDTALSLSEFELSFLEWISQYYHYPLGQLVNDVLPHFLKRPRPLKIIKGKSTMKDIVFNQEQASAWEKISSKGLDQFEKWLIHGITGSGKTVIYLKAIKEVLKKGKSVLFLLPEINLTPQFKKTFEEALDVEIIIFNSQISNSEKFEIWKYLNTNKDPKFILAVRSGIFLPSENLGLIIVDEEHDQSFKQDDRCTYNARDLALKKASMLNIPILLGSATPSLETYNNFVKSNQYITLKNRALSSTLPEIKLVDIKGAHASKSDQDYWPLTKDVVNEIDLALKKDEQVLVFINRLGYSNYVQCSQCGHQFTCPNCTTNLKYYKKRKELHCQTCSYLEPIPEMCPECMNMKLLPMGFGTEKVAEKLIQFFPEKSIGRFDRDEIKTQKNLENVLQKFHGGKTDILIGTQMLSKGHNFEKVNLVVILGIDSQLNFPDFRANEKVYQQITQVAGRAGRFKEEAKVLILTMSPTNKIFKYVQEHNFDEFYKEELVFRKICHSSPYTRMIMIYVNGKNQKEVVESAENAVLFLEKIIKDNFNTVEVLGPRPSMIEKKVNKFTWSFMLRASNLNDLHNLYSTFIKNFQTKSSISLKSDVDPYYFD